MDPVFFYVAVFWVLPVIAGYMVGQARGRTFQGVMLPLFFSFLGLIVVALLPPTAEKRREEEERLTRVIANAGIGRETPATTVSAQAEDPDLRVWATAEAVRRDPSLGASQDPESLLRLREAVDQVIAEKRTLDDLNAVKSREAEKEAARRAAELAALRSAEEGRRAEKRKAEIRARQKQEVEAERDRLAAMNPLTRWIATHKSIAWGTGVTLVVISMGIGIVALSSWQETQDAQAAAQAQEEREAVEAQAAEAEAAETEAEIQRCVDSVVPGADLAGCNLEGANLEGANLEGANLAKADLGGANLEGANLRRANLEGANLNTANLQGANLEGAKLWGASLQWISHSDATIWPKGFAAPTAGLSN